MLLVCCCFFFFTRDALLNLENIILSHGYECCSNGFIFPSALSIHLSLSQSVNDTMYSSTCIPLLSIHLLSLEFVVFKQFKIFCTANSSTWRFNYSTILIVIECIIDYILTSSVLCNCFPYKAVLPYILCEWFNALLERVMFHRYHFYNFVFKLFIFRLWIKSNFVKLTMLQALSVVNTSFVLR